MQTAKVKKMTTIKNSKLNSRSSYDYCQAYCSDGPVMYWMKKLDEYRRTNTDKILGISYHHFGFTVRLFLATHLASSRLIEDGREGLPGDQVKLVPTSPNHPSRKFRVIQLWDKDGSVANAGAIENNKTALTPFFNQEGRASNRRRWPARRKSPLRVDLVEEARKEEEEFQQLLNEVWQYRAKRPEWERGADGLDSLPGENFKEYRARVRPVLHQQW